MCMFDVSNSVNLSSKALNSRIGECVILIIYLRLYLKYMIGRKFASDGTIRYLDQVILQLMHV